MAFSAKAALVVITLMNLVGSLYGYYFYHLGIRMSDEIMVSMLFFPEDNDVTSSFDWMIFIIVPAIFIPTLLFNRIIYKLCGLNQPIEWSLQAAISKVKTIVVSLTACVIGLGAFLGGAYLLTDISLTTYRIRTMAEQMMPSYLMARQSNIKKLAKIYNSEIILQDYQALELSREEKDKESEPLVVVLVIGESLRSDRLAINGYNRNTTPLMSEMDNLFSFKDVVACSTTTSVSLPCMLTDETLEGWVGRFSSGDYTPKYAVSKVFTDLGFNTNFISSANKDYSIYIQKDFQGTTNVMLSNELRRQYISESEDFGDLLLVKALDSNIDKDTLYVLGTMGSHRDYFSRYTRNMAVFKPDMGNSLENIGNAYDNTVVYFDRFISDISKKLKDKNALLIYMSDHGESLGENGVFLHGAKVDTAPPEQRNVPMLVWMSDKYVQSNPEKHKNIQQWNAENQNGEAQLNHDFLFHSLLDCAGVISAKQGINEQQSVCSKYQSNAHVIHEQN